jgi:magnesium transporter
MTTMPDRLDAEALNLLWPALTDEERLDAFRLLSPDQSREFFDALSTTGQAELLVALSPAEAAVWMRVLPPDDAADVLQAVDESDRERLEAMLDTATRGEVRALLAYEEDEAGGLMNPRFARVRPDVTVDVAIRYLRRQTQAQLATFYYAYVLDSEQKLCGVVSFRQLFAAPGDARIDSIMERDVVSVPEDADQELVARLIAEYNLTAVPVVDGENRMRGVITVDDIVDVVQEEATEDIQKLGGAEALGAPYLNVSYLDMLRKRGVWLFILFIGELLTASAMGYFEHVLSQTVALAMFVPLIISSGGNSGSQAATIIVRALALQELNGKDWLRVFLRELRGGLTMGLFLGSLGAVRVLIWQGLGLYDYGPDYLRLAATVGASLTGVVTFGTLVGGMLPFLLRMLRLDPATSSAPFVATLVDVTGLVIYFSCAAVLLGIVPVGPESSP